MIQTSSRSAAIDHLISNKTEVRTYGALRGKYMRAGDGLGQLPDKYRPQFEADWKSAGLGLYVVYSYQTPIAWATDEGWRVPDVKYSVTTSRHQSKLYLATPRLDGDGYRS